MVLWSQMLLGFTRHLQVSVSDANIMQVLDCIKNIRSYCGGVLR